MSEDKKEFEEAIQSWMSTSIHTFMRKLHIYAKQKNLSFSQMNCIFKMKKHGPFQVNQVSNFFDMSKPAASQLLDKLVHMNLVDRIESKVDRRVKLHNLTEDGERLVDEFFTSVKHLHSEVVNSFKEEDYKQNTEVLNTLTNKLVELSNDNIEESKCLN